MYFLKNPVSFPLRTRIDADQKIEFLRSTLRLNCAPNTPGFDGELVLQITEVNDAVHFQPLALDHWDLNVLDAPIGNARVVELSFDGGKFTERLRRNKCDDSTRLLFESIAAHGSIALFIKAPGLDEASGFDNLVVNLSIRPLE